MLHKKLYIRRDIDIVYNIRKKHFRGNLLYDNERNRDQNMLQK